jgi:predicted metal-dependent enzyme (double-stranded beta helix superfamily)
MFEIERFVEDCRAALAADKSQKSLREVVARAVADPEAVITAVGEPQKAMLAKLHHSPDLTILNVIWGPMMTLMPHNHNMTAVIGIYTGREDNIFWRRRADGRVEAAGAEAISAREAVTLGHNIIHSVTNPIPRLTGALHVYTGDFFGAARSQWNAETLCEESYSAERAMKMFDDWNRLIPKDRILG